MKKILIATFLFAAANAYAHGGVSQNVGDAIVFLNQTPLSPLVGENVNLSFSITDSEFAPLANREISVAVIKSVLNHPEQDQQITKQIIKTDANGSFDFSYKFETSDYYDVELTFADPKTAGDDTTGFLIQPRDVAVQTKKSNVLLILTVGIAGVIMGLLTGLNRKK